MSLHLNTKYTTNIVKGWNLYLNGGDEWVFLMNKKENNEKILHVSCDVGKEN